MFKRKYLFLVLVFVLVMGMLGIPTIHGAYTLVWSDEFDGTSVNTGNWTFETGNNGGWGNGELEYYQAANATVSGGILTITAKKESVGGCSYTSARMISYGHHSFTYGKIEARLLVPKGKGLWPAFWMLGNSIMTGTPWADCGEIDIMEHVNTDDLENGTMHWNSGGGHVQYGQSVAVNNISTWHTYTLEWTSTALKWFVDGAQFCTGDLTINNTQCFVGKPFFILLNFAVGGAWPGPPDASTPFPAQYQIDYIRVYQDSGGGSTPTPTQPGNTPTPVPGNKTIPGTIQAESYDSMSGVQTETTSDTGGGLNVGWIETGDYMNYNVNVNTSGSYTVGFRVASPNANTQVQLKKGGTVLTTVTIPNTGGWQVWTTVNGTASLTSGSQTLQLYASVGGWNINWVSFTSGGGATATPTPTRPPSGTPTPTPPSGKVIPGKIEAESYNSMSGIQLETCSEGTQDVCYVDAGDWMNYNVTVQTTKAYVAQFRVSSPYSNTQLQLKLGATVLATVTVPNTGGWQTWATASATVNLTAGSQTLQVYAVTNGWNFNWLNFQ
jgi:beta-glucanase (GH16 family)